MTVDARDELIERIAEAFFNMDGTYWADSQAAAEAALSVVESATSTCPECGDAGLVQGYDADSGVPTGVGCEARGGQPGPLLILQVLGGEQVGDTWVSPQTHHRYVTDDGIDVRAAKKAGIEVEPVWRFLRRQEGPT